MTTNADLVARIDALEHELDAVRRAVSTTPAQESTHPPDAPDAAGLQLVSDRRGVVKLLAASAVGAAAGIALRSQPAAADDGEAIVQGTVNNASTATTLVASNDTALVLDGDGYGVEANGRAGNALFDAGGGAALGRPAWAGTLWVDEAGDWWGATKSDDVDGQWRKIIGPGTAGALHLLPAPKRVYDSRPGENPLSVGPKSPLVVNVALTIDATKNSSGVPSEARAVLITLTVTGTGAAGFGSVWPSGAWPGTSSINFTGANQTVATTTVVGLVLGARFELLSSATTHVIIDVVGYYI